MSATPQREDFRDAFGRFATGVAVITSAAERGTGGMTANALCSLSLDPLLVLVCFAESARTLPLVKEAGRFAINILRVGQEGVAAHFASKVPEHEKLDGVAHRFEQGVPVLDDALAWAACDLEDIRPGGDHSIAIGAVTALGYGDGEPLVYYRGGYRGLSL
jgi:3-hydroxy-9,10-secoandrosta-1,3,5(10)-triene-9,17-dione monooxygenase reductase component